MRAANYMRLHPHFSNSRPRARVKASRHPANPGESAPAPRGALCICKFLVTTSSRYKLTFKYQDLVN